MKRMPVAHREWKDRSMAFFRSVAGWLLITVVCLSLLTGTLVLAAPLLEPLVLMEGVAGGGRLATSPSGQTLYVLHQQDGAVTALQPFEPSKRWGAIPPAPAGSGRRTVAIACLDSSTLALVCCTDQVWSVRVHRVAAPGEAAPGDEAVQTVNLGKATGEITGINGVEVAVSPARDWLAVVGLPAPMPPLLRSAIAGSRLGGFTERRCPRGLADRPEAFTLSPRDEWVLFMPQPAGTAALLSMHSGSGLLRLLQVGSGLQRVRDAAYSKDGASLWALGEGMPTVATGSVPQEGLWRIDAALEQGRQQARATCVTALVAPQSLQCLPNQSIAVVHGRDVSRVVRLAVENFSGEQPRGNEPARED
jgi:hypothetical protein